MKKERGRLYSLAGAVSLLLFTTFSFFYLNTLTGRAVSEKSLVYIQGMPLILISLLFFAGWFLIVKRKRN